MSRSACVVVTALDAIRGKPRTFRRRQAVEHAGHCGLDQVDDETTLVISRWKFAGAGRILLPHLARVLTPKWYSVAEVAQLLGYGLSKTKMLVATGQIRSLKDGGHRRILPEWVDDYVTRRAGGAG